MNGLKRWKVVFLVFATFVVGAVTGAFFVMGSAKDELRRNRDPQRWFASTPDRWRANMKLTPEQEQKVRPILQQIDDELNNRRQLDLRETEGILWRGEDRSANIFVRAGYTPADRNLVSFYIDGGIGLKGLFGRKDDVLTFGVAHSKISGHASALDQDTLFFNGPPFPIRTAETVFELSYIFQVAPWWTIQPDLQYIVRPAGGVPHPDDATQVLPNAFLAGVRTTVKF